MSEYVNPMDDPKHAARVRLSRDLQALRLGDPTAVADDVLAEIVEHAEEWDLDWGGVAAAQHEIDRRAAEVTPS